jgi:hypothetical protein
MKNGSARAGLSLLIALLVSLVASVAVASPIEDLAAGFEAPPDAARPWVYWFWLNGNITAEGITADLEAMARQGIGGVLIMEVDQGAPLGPVAFASPEWRKLFAHVVREAHRLGLEVNMNNDAGWCGSGGPWVRPEHAMQRVVWTETPVSGGAAVEMTVPQPAAVAGYYRDIAVFAVPAVGEYRIEDVAGKSAVVRRDLGLPATYPDAPPDSVIPRSSIINVTEQMDAEGNLTWQAPAGDWVILRMGHTPTGSMNAPAHDSGRGLECDKLSKEAVEAHFLAFIGNLIRDSLPLAGHTLVATHIDSWETGSQNWTPRFRQEFLRLRGYDPLPYLPVFTGRVVGSLEVSERFLWDVRLTVSQLLLDNYAGHMGDLACERGLRLSIEAYGDTTVDNISYAGRADEPMAEFWSWPAYGASGTLNEMASGAHVYGKPIVGAEAFTAGDGEKWLYHPGSIKAMGDWAFALGINRFVFHRYALQPWADRRPGMSMGPWGLHYERPQTWWEESGAWHQYLSRCQYLLQQGLPVVDFLYLAPEGAPRSFAPPPSALAGGYKADVCSPEALLTRASALDGRIVFPDGMSYRALVLPGAEAMSPRLLAKIAELAHGGATIFGAPPRAATGLSGWPLSDQRVRARAEELWSSGQVLEVESPQEWLAESGIPEDLAADRILNWTHRRIGDSEVYFVANGLPHAVFTTCTFRVAGRQPWLWDPESGQREAAAAFIDDGGALPAVVERFVATAVSEAHEAGVGTGTVILDRMRSLSEMVGGYDFAQVVEAYWRGHDTGSDVLKGDAIRWLRGEFSTKTDARSALGVRTIIDDAEVYDHLKLTARLVRLAGFGGLLVCLDEMVNLYKMANTRARNSNYEQVLRIVNDCLQSGAEGLGFLMGGTPDFLTDTRKGLYSYEALRSRLVENRFAVDGLVDLSGPVVRLASLTPEDMYVLLTRLRHVFAGGDPDLYLVPDEALQAFMECCSQQIGDAYFRTPRNTIKEFLDLLAVLKQNPGADWHDLLGGVRVQAEADTDLAPLSALEEDEEPESRQREDDDELSGFRL